MPLGVQGFSWGVSRVVGLLFLQMRRCILGSFDRPGSPFLGILVVPLWFGRGPLVRGHYSSVGGHLMSSIASAGDGFALFGRRIVCSHSRMGGFVGCLGMGSVGRGPSIRQCCQSFDGRRPLPRLSVLGLGRWGVPPLA